MSWPAATARAPGVPVMASASAPAWAYINGNYPSSPTAVAAGERAYLYRALPSDWLPPPSRHTLLRRLSSLRSASNPARQDIPRGVLDLVYLQSISSI